MDALDRLEQKIRRAMAEMETLREQNQRLGRDLEKAAAPGGGGDDVEQLREELRLLHEERAAIRERVERLVALLEEAS
jgi:FtsZ-binding cell division protein ZapB